MHSTEITVNRALELQAQNTPDKIFITHKSATYSYEHTHELVSRLATFLKNSGVMPGDTVCIMLPRTPELIIGFLAATKLGAFPAPINYLLCADDVVELIDRIAPKVIISCPELLLAEIEAGIKTSGLLLIDTNNKKETWVAWKTAVTAELSHEEKSIEPTDVAYLNFTTGSSGQAKGALTTHANIYWNTRAAVEAFGINEKDVHLCMFASFAHSHELFARALYTGGHLVLLQEINPKTIIRTINSHSITCIMGLAPMYEMIAKNCASMKFPSLRVAESGGMFTRQTVNEKFQEQFGIPILSVWGSTETTGIALANTPAHHRTDGSMGKPCPHYQVKLVHSTIQDVANGEFGELYFRGPGVVSGYVNSAPLVDENGWFASGDMARMDEDGFYYFIERKSGMLKIAGLQVYPLQIELLLLAHPRISEVAILETPDKRKGAALKAYVVLNDDEDFDRDDILTFCKGKIPRYMIPKQIEILESLPKIGSGKINKKVLADS